MGASSSDYSEWNIDEKWSSHDWKSGEMLEARKERPVGGQQFTQDTDKFVIDDSDMYGLWHRHRMELFAKIAVILA